MLRVCLAGADSLEAARLYELLRDRPDVQVGPMCSTGAEMVRSIRRDSADVALFPTDWIDVARAIRRGLQPKAEPGPSFVLVTSSPRLALRARALSSGLDGIVDTSSDPEQLVMNLNRIASGTVRLTHDEELTKLNLLPGLMARDLILTSDDDESLADLIAAGLTDEAISGVLDWNIQETRNRIADLLAVNDMRYRTQLAIARSSSIRIPDFSRPFAE